MLISELETPAYVYDLDEVRRSHDLLRRSLPQPSILYYSLKANPHPAVARTLSARGVQVEVSSVGELTTALGSGFTAHQVFYTGPGRRDRDLEQVLRAGVRWFSVDSPSSLDQLQRLCERDGITVKCSLRINDSGLSRAGLTMGGGPSAFGADVSWVEASPDAFADRANVTVAGLHLFQGTNLVDEDDLLAQFDHSIETARRLGAAGVDLDLLNLGGGFGAPFAREGALPRFPRLAARLESSLDHAFPGWRRGEPRVAFESGRYLTATAGRLLVRVLDVKISFGRTVVVLESGINHLGGMSGLRRLPEIAPMLVHRPSSTELVDTLITGPLCTPLDRWSSRTAMPPPALGDVVVVPNVGAYGLSASLVAFLGHPFPIEAVVERDEVTEITRLELRRQRE